MTDRGVVDAHIHQWDPFTTPRIASTAAKVVRRVPPLLPLLERTFPRRTRDFVGESRYLFNEYLPADYRADGGPTGVDTVVHVQAGWHDGSPDGFGGRDPVADDASVG